MAKKKLTKEQIRAKARAYANKMTVGKALDIHGFVGKAAAETLSYMADKNMDHFTASIPRGYTGLNPDTGEFVPEDMVTGYAGSINRGIEKGFFKFIGIKGPRTEINTMGDVLDWGTYFGKSSMRAYERKDNMLGAHNAWYKVQYGVNLYQWGFDAYEPMEMITDKIVPYVVQKKLRQIPFLKRVFAKINKLV